MVKIQEELNKMGLQAIKSWSEASIKIFNKQTGKEVVCLSGSDLSSCKNSEETWEYIKDKLNI